MQVRSDVRSDIAREFDALFVRAHRHHPKGIADAVAQIENRWSEIDLAGFDFREVKNVVNHREQPFGGIPDGFG